MSKIKNLAIACKNYIGLDPALFVLVLFAGAYFCLYYLTDPARPADVFSVLGFQDYVKYPLGWWGYYDQSQYIGMANALANFDYAALQATYSYGLGYPVVAVPVLWLGIDKDPFVLFNLFAFVFTIFATYKAAKHFISPFAGLLAGFALTFATPLIVYTAQPWNSTVCLVAISSILLIATAKAPGKLLAITAGFMVGWVFAARYVDIVWLLPIAAASLYRGSFKQLIRLGLFSAIGAFIWLVPVLYSHNSFFGSPLKTPYVNHIGLEEDSGSDQQLSAYQLDNIPSAALGMFVSPRLAQQEDVDRGWLVTMFWILAAIPGAFILLKNPKNRWLFGTFIVANIVAYLFYLSFRASTPYSLKYGILHYFKMFWPGLVIMAVAFFDKQLRKTMEYTNQTVGRKKPKKA
jgi:hypothetical protein